MFCLQIYKEFRIANSALSTIIKNRGEVRSMFESSMFEPERKQMRTAKHEDLETAVLIWFKQAKSQNAFMPEPLLFIKADELSKQMSIEFFRNPGKLKRKRKKKMKKKERRFVEKCDEAINVLLTMTVDWLHSALPSIL